MNVQMSRLQMIVMREAATLHASVYSRARGLNTVPPSLSEETPSGLRCSLGMTNSENTISGIPSKYSYSTFGRG